MKAIEETPRFDLRRAKAMALTAALMEEVDDILPHETRRFFYNRLLTVLYNNGAAWTTDKERSMFGLESRDELGWTPSERVAEEKRRNDAMLMMANHIVLNSTL